ncbi:phytanoyl-CoA dioxygenase family protein [Kutzneria viridogrisea]|uniref:Phytanoyl-CoA dioxygenase n=1 Tax=Kutzneria viridogrisea TaxID=47990 RepID=A0ABR6BD27_9PSEU|nr:hypothetical protein [Kutzneria viridogrisea]
MRDQFLADGFVKVEGAFPVDTASACAEILWRQTGCDPQDPGTWTKPVHWVFDRTEPPFIEAANTPALHAAFDELVGPGRWLPRRSLGSFPLRFPHEEEPDDAGWHIEASFLPEGATQYHANVSSRERALLMLFLFSEVGPQEAPTRIRVGSHLDVPPVLARFGETGASPFTIAAEVDQVSAHRPTVLATGSPGDVYLCHPFLVHAAQPHHGTRPRFMAQPPLQPAGPFDIAQGSSPVELAIRTALTGQAS